jgi:hypothetical protein
MTTCQFFFAGHRLHPVQASLAWNTPRDENDSRVRVPLDGGVSYDRQSDRHVPVTVWNIHDNGLIVCTAGDEEVALWHHDADGLRDLMTFQGSAHTWVPDASILIINEFTVDDPLDGRPIPRVSGHAYLSVTLYNNPARRECAN